MMCFPYRLAIALLAVLLWMLSTPGSAQAKIVEIPLELMDSGMICDTYAPPRGEGGGTIHIKSSQVHVEDGSKIAAEAGGQANGGDICILTHTYSADDRGKVSVSNVGSGDAGHLLLMADESIKLNHNSQLEAISQGQGPGGDILIVTDLYEALSGSQVHTDDQGDGDAGRLELVAEQVYLSDDSDLLATDEGNGRGGHIVISSDRFVAQHDSDVMVMDKGEGQGGSVDLIARQLADFSDHSDIDAEVPDQGLGGEISILAGILVATPDSHICLGEKGELSITTFARTGPLNRDLLCE